MKNILPEQLKFVLSSEKVVYVFGAGMSSALSGCHLSWHQWIACGINYISDSAVASELRLQFATDSSAVSLIDVISDVITETKKNQTYDAWMQSSFEGMTIANHALADSLSLAKIPRDIIATTNYDSILETATGLGSLDYAQPSDVFHMIDNGRADSVIHLHGRYNSEIGVDNIIASQEQYEKIFNDEAAQFIQRLLGTRILIFIGCGQTTEDINISRFIAFASKVLRLDVSYFFIKRAGDSVSELPENFVTIDYGSDHSDLPEFIHDMLMYRATEFMNRNPIIGRTALKTTPYSAFGNYHFTSDEIDFVGRRDELRALLEFVDSPASFSWWAITGQAGSGKSRLALELMSRIAWYSFFLNDRANTEQAKSFVPFCDTLIVIDYVQGHEKAIAGIINVLRKIFRESTFKLRLLLLERNSNKEYGSWYRNMVSELGYIDKVDFEASRHVHEDSFTLELCDLDIAAVNTFIGKICALHCLPPDHLRDEKLRIQYWEKFENLHYRTLFVRLYVEAWIENNCTRPRYDTFDGILKTVVEKEQARWLEFLGGDIPLCNSLIRILVRASASEGIKTDDIPVQYADDWKALQEYFKKNTLAGRQRKDSIANVFADVLQNIEDNHGILYPQYPDIIKEYMFAFYASDDILAVANELWKNAGAEFSRFMFRSLCDFRDNAVFINIIENASEPYSDYNILDARTAFLTKTIMYPHETLDSLIDRIDKEYQFWHDMPYVENAEAFEDIRFALTKMRGLNGVAEQYGGLMKLNEMTQSMDEIVSMKGHGLYVVQAHFLEERMNACSISNQPKLSSHFGKQLLTVIEKFTEQTENNEFELCLQFEIANNLLMNYLLNENFDATVDILKKWQGLVDFSSATVVYMFALMSCNVIDFALMRNRGRYIKKCSGYIDECLAKQPNDKNVLTKYYHAKARSLNYDYLLKKKNDFKAEIVSLLNEIEGLGCDMEGEAWSIAAVFALNIISVDDPLLAHILIKAEEYIEADHSDYAANVWIMVHIFIFGQKKVPVPKDVVERAYAYYLRVPESESTRESFFELLIVSTENENMTRYFPKRVLDGMIQDVLHNPLYSSDATQQLLLLREMQLLEESYDEEPDNYGLDCINLQGLYSYSESPPFVGRPQKVGANEPCPCGSGKKFKRCCRGKGVYDYF